MSTARRTSPAITPPAATDRNVAQVFLSPTVPAALRPTVSQRALQVALIWGADQVMDLQQVGVTDEQRSRRAAPLPLTEELVAERSRPLFQLLRSGEHVLLVPDGSSLRIGRDAEWFDLPSLVARGEASPVQVPVRGARYVLGLHERLDMAAGELRVMGRYLRPERAQRTPLGERIDTLFISRLIIVLLFGLAMVAMFRMSNQIGSESDEALAIRRPDWKVVRVTDPPPAPRLGGDHPASRTLMGGAPAHKPDPTLATSPKPPLTKTQVYAQKVHGLLSALENLPVAPDLLNQNLNNAVLGLEAVPGGQVASAEDGPGRGPRGYGPGGPGVLGMDSIGGHGPGHGPGGPRGDLDGVLKIPGTKKITDFGRGGATYTSDGLAKEVVERIVRRHWNEIKYCYEKELSHDPNLAGKVTVNFEIGPIGDVIKAELGESTLGSAAVASCITANVQRWQFPAPSGGGVVDVHYPFLFQSK